MIEPNFAWMPEHIKTINDLENENATLRAQLAEMRAVLEWLEYAAADGMCRVCPMCKGLHASMAHIHTCPLGRALGRPECGGDGR